MTILDRIVATKREEIAAANAIHSLADLKIKAADEAPCRDFVGPFIGPSTALRIIAEIKKASPSAGIIRAHFDPVVIATMYERAGATALSVLTDRQYFQGDLAYLRSVRTRVKLPILRKDFIIDPYQLYQSRVAGADAILLIAALLEKAQLEEYLALANTIDLHVLIEIHDGDDLEKTRDCQGRFLLGVNNRDLKTFTVSLETSKAIAQQLPKTYPHPLVSESGLKTRRDLLDLADCGFGGFLIGETLMREIDIENALRHLISAKFPEKD